jgi:hypothetical protein
MKTWRHYLPSKTVTGSLLVIAVFCISVFQLHSHFHSADAHHADHQHGHISKLHLFDLAAQQDHHDGDLVIEAKATGILKKQLDDEDLHILVVLMLAMLYLLQPQSGRKLIKPENLQVNRSRHRHLTPQLRAPPISL